MVLAVITTETVMAYAAFRIIRFFKAKGVAI